MKLFEIFHKKTKKNTYDHENLRPVIRASICNGEQVAGFKNIHTGEFNEVMFIRNNKDMDEFLRTYNISTNDITKEY